MNDQNLSSLGDALKKLLQKSGLDNTITEHRIKEAWHKTVGDYCSRHTETVWFAKGELSVKISSPIVKQELLYTKTEIIAKINEILGNEVVKTIRIF
jgi:predicted nucleic acid-binding Zn ribbon protein